MAEPPVAFILFKDLCRLEGFKDPWEHCVYRGNLLQPSSTLQECGIDGAAPVVAVRKSLFPEGEPQTPSSLGDVGPLSA